MKISYHQKDGGMASRWSSLHPTLPLELLDIRACSSAVEAAGTHKALHVRALQHVSDFLWFPAAATHGIRTGSGAKTQQCVPGSTRAEAEHGSLVSRVSDRSLSVLAFGPCGWSDYHCYQKPTYLFFHRYW